MNRKFQILFQVGSGRLKLNPDDSRADTPDQLKELIVTCSQFEREKRLNFVQVTHSIQKNLIFSSQQFFFF